MATESATLRAAARIVSLGAFWAATRALDRPRIKKIARRFDKKINRFQGFAEAKADDAGRNLSHHRVYLAAGVTALAVAGALIARAASD